MAFFPPGEVTTTIDLLGVFSAGVLGGDVAARKRFDAVGFAALGLASGLGGGIVRDLLLGAGTPLGIAHASYVVTGLAAAGVAFVTHLNRYRYSRIVLTTLDALAVGFWAVAGSQRSIAAGLGVLSACLLGVISAVGGGVIRDVLVGERPVVFAENGTLYATAALAAALVYLALEGLGLHPGVATPIAVAVGFCTRMASLRYGWTLPPPTRAPH